MDDFVFTAPDTWTACRITVAERDDEIVKAMFKGVTYLAGYEEVHKKKVNKHYHIMVAGKLTDAVRKRMSRYAEGKPGSYTWTKADYHSFEVGVRYTIKDKECFGNDTAFNAYARSLPPYVAGEKRNDGAPENPQDRKKCDWFLTERNVRRLYHKYKTKVTPNERGEYPFLDVVQWICRNTNWKLNKYFVGCITWRLAAECESGDDGCDRVFAELKRVLQHRPL